MIIGYVGTPGSGKTYEAVKRIIDNLRSGRIVCTNIDGLEDPVHQEALKCVAGLDDYQFSQQFYYLTKDQSVRFWEPEQVNAGTDLEFSRPIAPPGSILIIDEVHKLFSNRDWASEKNKGFAEWASTHRHEGYDVILITQDIEKVDKHVRSLLEWCYFFRKINFLGAMVKNSYIRYAYVGDDHNGKPVSSNRLSYNPQIFPCYKSYSTADAKEVGFMRHTNVLKHPVFFVLPLVLCYGLYSLFHSSLAHGDLFGTQKRAAQRALVQPPRPIPSLSPPPTPSPSFTPISVSSSAPVPNQSLRVVRHALKKNISEQDNHPYREIKKTNYWKITKIDTFIDLGDKVILGVKGEIVEKWKDFDKQKMVAMVFYRNDGL